MLSQYSLMVDVFSCAVFHGHYTHCFELIWIIAFPHLSCLSFNPSYQDQSGEQSEDYETEEQLADRILTAALDFVPQHGWTVEAIAAGAEVSG